MLPLVILSHVRNVGLMAGGFTLGATPRAGVLPHVVNKRLTITVISDCEVRRAVVRSGEGEGGETEAIGLRAPEVMFLLSTLIRWPLTKLGRLWTGALVMAPIGAEVCVPGSSLVVGLDPAWAEVWVRRSP